MPQNKYALARYRLIDQLLKRYSFVKSSQIVEYCRIKLRYSISQRSIQMDIEAMKNDTFLGIYAPVDYCRSRKAYYYTEKEFIFNPLHISKEEIRLLKEVCEYLKGRITENRYNQLVFLVEKIKNAEVM